MRADAVVRGHAGHLGGLRRFLGAEATLDVGGGDERLVGGAGDNVEDFAHVKDERRGLDDLLDRDFRVNLGEWLFAMHRADEVGDCGYGLALDAFGGAGADVRRDHAVR